MGSVAGGGRRKDPDWPWGLHGPGWRLGWNGGRVFDGQARRIDTWDVIWDRFVGCVGVKASS